MTQQEEAKGVKKDNGALRSDQNQLIFKEGFSFSGYERDGLYLNLSAGKFREISGCSGIDSISDGRAAVFADFDNDGDYDVFLTTIQGAGHLLFRNNVGQASNFLRVSLAGTKSGRDAYGAVVRMKTSAGTLTKIKSGGSGFLAQHDPRLLFGLGKDSGVEAIEVTWPDGKVEKFPGAKAGSSVLLHEGGSGSAEGVTLLSERRAKLPDPMTRVDTVERGLKIRRGHALPEIKMKTLGGGTTTLAAQLKPGRRTLINLWATWCVPCAREMPELQQLAAGFAGQGIDVIGLNLDTDPSAEVKGYLSKRQISYLNLAGGIPTIEGIYATDQLFVPLSLLVNDRGIVLELIPGWSPETRRRFAQLSGTP